MAKGIKDYFDFAEVDYIFFTESCKAGRRDNALASLGQNICERYLKHIVDTLDTDPVSVEEHNEILHTHTLRKILTYVSGVMNIEIPAERCRKIMLADGYYFTTRYPGEDSYIATPADVEIVYDAVTESRNLAVELCPRKEQEKDNATRDGEGEER